MENILFEVEGNVGYITLNRPSVYNSFNRAMSLEVQAALDQCKKDENVRAIYLSGAGKAFCAGQDLQEVTSENAPDLTKILTEHLNPIVTRIREIEVPVVAAINGVAAGAGANIALACDIVVADEKATFIQAFSKIGLIPDSGGTFFLPRLIGLQKATALMMLGEKIDAQEAERIGMIYDYYTSDCFEEKSKALAIKLSQMPTKGLALTKRALSYSFTNDLATQLAIEDQLQTAAGQTDDYKEGVNAFVEKRKPVFTGK